MNIYGFTKTTLLDYPGHVASTVFAGGCNFRCPFCHNYDLVLNPDIYPMEDENTILEFLRKRRGILTGVTISGGEPTLNSDLSDFIIKIKSLGYLVKLDTNGYRPEVLEELIKSNLIDYVAMDIKSSRRRYDIACGIGNIDISKISQSMDILKQSGIEYELRTTAVKGIHEMKDFADIADWIPCECNYFLQNYNTTDGINKISYNSFSLAEMNLFLDIIKTKVPNTFLRGIE